ncbi:hypothetical protein [Mycoplasmopsis agassizii]|uniref:Uncharacterized protein n=1 Tax=Mycoplasmopsis agassizii TaxID=33922 RepID=A0ABX4H4K3_9BACT|nr:hypothetical protein [Mycoplasmopsis agassizii]PAF54815.1 hypothetical protein CJF60_03705 [Mycoplasmopsis agassizii]SMC19307.1 hypothetical protein SAMN02745179_00883 [Mycoplasmopsis agassizii]
MERSRKLGKPTISVKQLEKLAIKLIDELKVQGGYSRRLKATLIKFTKTYNYMIDEQDGIQETFENTMKSLADRYWRLEKMIFELDDRVSVLEPKKKKN